MSIPSKMLSSALLGSIVLVQLTSAATDNGEARYKIIKWEGRMDRERSHHPSRRWEDVAVSRNGATRATFSSVADPVGCGFGFHKQLDNDNVVRQPANMNFVLVSYLNCYYVFNRKTVFKESRPRSGHSTGGFKSWTPINLCDEGDWGGLLEKMIKDKKSIKKISSMIKLKDLYEYYKHDERDDYMMRDTYRADPDRQHRRVKKIARRPTRRLERRRGHSAKDRLVLEQIRGLEKKLQDAYNLYETVNARIERARAENEDIDPKDLEGERNERWLQVLELLPAIDKLRQSLNPTGTK